MELGDAKSILAALGGGRGGGGDTKPDPEVAAMELRAYYDRYAAENPFNEGDIITPRPGVGQKYAGWPHIVLDSQENYDEIPVTINAADVGQSAAAHRNTLRVAVYIPDAGIVTFLGQHQDYESWDEEKHGSLGEATR